MPPSLKQILWMLHIFVIAYSRQVVIITLHLYIPERTFPSRMQQLLRCRIHFITLYINDKIPSVITDVPPFTFVHPHAMNGKS